MGYKWGLPGFFWELGLDLDQQDGAPLPGSQMQEGYASENGEGSHNGVP